MGLRIGIVDLCTSHPCDFIPILRELGCEIVSVWDGGEVQSFGYAHEFAEQFAIPHVCDRLEEMPGRVDAVMLHAANWDRHFNQVRLFVEAGVVVCVDKPMVGCLADVEQLLALDHANRGLIFGGSACQFAEEVTALREEVSASQQVVSALVIGHADMFSYGIHTLELAQALLGYDAESVMCLTESPLGSYLVRFARGFDLNIQAYNPAPGWFVMVNTFEGGALTTRINTARLYRPFLEQFVRFVRGETEGWSLEAALQPIRVALAMTRAQSRPRQWVNVNDPALASVEYDGAAFAKQYAEAKRRGGSVYLDIKNARWAAAVSSMA